MKRVHRRTFLASIAILGSAATGWSFFKAEGDIEPVEDLLRIFGTYRTHARAVGERYLECVPEEANRQKLIELLSAEFGPLPQGHDPRAVKHLIQRKIKQDFAEAKTVEVDGWLLSRTEARLCSLLEMST
jgi:hypothetical protein